MSANLPLDANDEDIQQRGLSRPSALDEALPVSNAYQALQSAYDNSTIGAISKDNIWPSREVEELQSMTPAQRRDYLTARGVIPNASSIPSNINLPEVDNLVDNFLQEGSGNFTEKINNLQQNLDTAIATGANISLDSYGQSLTGTITQPAPLTAPAPGGSYTPVGQQPRITGDNVYAYEVTEMYSDRYDMSTGKKLYKGIASGTGGGSGAEANNTAGSSGLATQQTEVSPPPPNLSSNDTSTEQYDDAILRQSRQQEESSQGTPSSRLDGKDGDLYSPKPEGRLSNRLDSKGETPPPPPPPKLSNRLDSKGSVRASRREIIDSRRQSASDIRFARANGETLVRLRRPDGTYYAGKPRNVSNKQLPQRYKDF
jgi:hypothetical protein